MADEASSHYVGVPDRGLGADLSCASAPASVVAAPAGLLAGVARAHVKANCRAAQPSSIPLNAYSYGRSNPSDRQVRSGHARCMPVIAHPH